MAKQQQIISDLFDTIDGTISRFNKAIPGIQQDIANELAVLMKDLQIKNGKLMPSTANLRLLAKIRNRINAIVLNPDYKNEAREYIKAFNKVATLQNKYFETISRKFQPNKLLDELQAQTIEDTVNSLTEAGIGVNVSDKIVGMLRNNITAGSKYTDAVKQVTNLTVTNDKGAGLLERYSKQITTDALNQYSAQYTNVVTADLGLEWFMYDGVIIDTSRPFCKALVAKKYIHVSELPAIVLGKFKEFEREDGKIDPRTKLPVGMVDGTTALNFHIYRGGYNCGHQLIPVDEAVVPFATRIDTYTRLGIAFDADGYRIRKRVA